MDIERIIQAEANESTSEVKERAQDEINETDRKKKLKNDALKQDIVERKDYAHRVFILMCLWLAVVLLIFIASGNGNLTYSDSVLIALLTTTSANVIGLFVLVAKYLFNPKS